MIKFKKYISITFLLMGLLLLVMGCAEDESPVQPVSELKVSITNGPSGNVAFNAYVTYKWAARGGSGSFTKYTYTFGTNPAVETIETNATFVNLQAGTYAFSVMVTDSEGKTATSATRSITVVADAVAPTVAITGGPAEGSYIAASKPVTFNWTATDSSTFGAIAGYTFSLQNDSVTYSQASAGMVQATSVTFDSLLAGGGEYTFSLTVTDNAGNTTDAAVKFNVIPANVLWIDDHPLGGLSPEFREKMNEWSVALNGFAWTDYDIADNWTGHGSTLTDLEALLNGPGATVETVIWDCEHPNGFELYFSAGGGPGTLLGDFLDNGGNLILIGGDIQDQIWETTANIPTPGEFEDVYQGIDTISVSDTVITADTVFVNSVWTIVYDTTITTLVGWDYDDYVTLTGANGYDDMIIDVGKDPDTHQPSYVYGVLHPNTTPILLDDDTGLPSAFIFDPPTRDGKVATLGINIYFSPTAQITALIQKILIEEFGM